MKMRGWWAAAVLVGLGLADAGGLSAQRRGGPGNALGPQGPDRAAAAALRLADELELTDQQRSALEALREESLAAMETFEQEALDARQEMRARMRTAPRDDAEQREALRDEMRERMDALRTQRQALTEPLRTRLEEILTAEQREELRAELRPHRFEGRRGNRPAGRRMGRGGARVRDGSGGPGAGAAFTAPRGPARGMGVRAGALAAPGRTDRGPRAR